MGFSHILANCLLGACVGFLTGRFFADLGPLRIIDARLFQQMQLCEWTYGWTIEAQIRAVRLGATIREIPVRERRRLAGEQKISRVSWRRTVKIGAAIFAAAWRTRFRERASAATLPQCDAVEALADKS